MQRSVLAGFRPPDRLQGSHRSRPRQAACLSTLQTGGITACLLFPGSSPPQLFCFSRLFPFSHLFFSVRPLRVGLFAPTFFQDRLSVLSKDETYLLPASSWGCAKTGFTFISPAQASDCWGGQGQLGAGPQLGAVPWSGLASSSSYQA